MCKEDCQMKTYKMTHEELKTGRRFLQKQARDSIKVENDFKMIKALTKILDIYVRRIGKNFDPVLSSKVDCLNWLIEN